MGPTQEWSAKGVWKNIMKSWTDKHSRLFCRLHYFSCQERGQQIGFDGHKKTKGCKIHIAVTPQSLRLAIDLAKWK